MDTRHVDGAVLHTVRDQVAVLQECDGAAGSSLGADMADGSAAGSTGEPAVGDQCHRAVDPLVAADGLGGHQHLGHTAATGALIADDDDFAGIDLVVDHGIVGVLLMVEHPGLGVDHFPLVHGAGGVLEHGALGSDVALQDGHRALLGSLLHREDHLVAGQAVVGKVAQVPVEPVVLVQVLQILAQGLAGDGHHVQIQHIPQHPLHHGDAAGEPEGLRQLGAGGEDVAQVGHLMVDLVEELDGQVIAQLPGDGGQMDGGVGGATDGAVDDDGVLERRGGHDLAGGDVLLHQLHDLPAGIAGVLDDVPHGGGSQSRAGQRHAQSLGDALHGGCGAQEGARAHGRAAGQLIIPHFPGRDGVLALLTQGDVAGHQGRGHVGAGPHGAAGHEDGGDVHPGRSLQVGGNGLVTAGRQDHAVPGHCGGVDLHHVGQCLTGSQHHVHAVMALGAAVADVRGIVLGRLAALFVHAVHRLLHQLVQVPAAGVRVAVHALHHDLGLFDVRVVPARAHFQGVELRPQHPIVMTFLHHLLFLLFP